jgi:hypothetical protein
MVQADRGPELAGPWSNRGARMAQFQLDPKLVAVSCERIKEQMSKELGATEPWRGKVFVSIHSEREFGPKPVLVSQKFVDGWQYQLGLPDRMEAAAYVRSVVQVLLTEMANRKRNPRLAEIPLWLTEGLSQHLLASSAVEIILAPPRETVNGLSVSTKRVTGRIDNPVDQARKKLGQRAPVTFEALSWQAEDELSGAAADLYRGSAQLFVVELLHLPDGRASMRGMLAQLADYRNWQFAFFRAFHSHFECQLDVEKWWALCVVGTAVASPPNTWTLEESWNKLNQGLLVSDPASGPQGVAGRGPQLTLQAVVEKWGRERQIQLLAYKVRELQLLRLRLAPELSDLAQDYCQALESYLQSPRGSGPKAQLGRPPSPSGDAEETLRRLNALDGRRAALRLSALKPTTNQAAKPPPTAKR